LVEDGAEVAAVSLRIENGGYGGLGYDGEVMEWSRVIGKWLVGLFMMRPWVDL
jgi:hypothetical protein